MYQKAQSTLPKENLTSEQRNIARQCDLEIRAAREQTEQPPNTAHGAVHGEPPWVRAVKIIAEFESHGPTSEEFLSSVCWCVLRNRRALNMVVGVACSQDVWGAEGRNATPSTDSQVRRAQ